VVTWHQGFVHPCGLVSQNLFLTQNLPFRDHLKPHLIQNVLSVGQPEPLPFEYSLNTMKTYREIKYILTQGSAFFIIFRCYL